MSPRLHRNTSPGARAGRHHETGQDREIGDVGREPGGEGWLVGTELVVDGTGEPTAEGHATREEIEKGLRAWLPWFAAMLAENGHGSGYTMSGWLESEAFREEPSAIHNWTPEVTGPVGDEFP